jgi:hypothetical protein
LEIYVIFVNLGVLFGTGPNNIRQLARVHVTTEKILLLINCNENP